MFPRLPTRATFVADTNFVSGTQKMFLILFRNILCPQQMFPSLRSPRNIMGNNVSATMCPRLPGPLSSLITKHESRSGRKSARGLESADRAQRAPYKKDIFPLRSEQAWLIRELLHDENYRKIFERNAGLFGTVHGPILREYWTSNGAIWLVNFSYCPYMYELT